MIEHLHSLICGRLILDKNTGLASYIDIIEGITLRDPNNFKLPLFSLVTKFWIKDGIEDDQILEVKVSRKKNKKGKWINLQTIQIPLDKKGENALVELKVENLDIEEPGLWVFDVKWRLKDSGNWKKGANIPFKVRMAESKNLGKKWERK